VNNNWNMKTFYGSQHGAVGLVDYPFYNQQWPSWLYHD
jgi:hypothetical protein